MLKYRIDVLAALKAAGYNTNRIRKEKLFAESTLQNFRTRAPFSWANLEMLCKLLDCQPSNVLTYEKDE